MFTGVMIRVEAMRYHAFRQLTDSIKKRPPGIGASVNKLVSTELNHDIAALAMEVMGAYGSLARTSRHVIDRGVWPVEFMFTLGLIIGVAAVIVMVAIGSGARSSIESRIRSAGTNVVTISAGSNAFGPVRQGSGATTTLTSKPSASNSVVQDDTVSDTSAPASTRCAGRPKRNSPTQPLATTSAAQGSASSAR